MSNKKIEIDGTGEEKSSWEFCGAFPIEEVLKGRRACREGWRNRGEPEDDFDMLAVVLIHSDGEYIELGLERESATHLEDLDPFKDERDRLANDWYLEIKEGK